LGGSRPNIDRQSSGYRDKGNQCETHASLPDAARWPMMLPRDKNAAWLNDSTRQAL
jgi:hypothetical protein